MSIAFVLGTTLDEIDEALAHAAATRRRAALSGAASVVASLGRYIDALLDQRPLCGLPQKNPATALAGPDTSQGLSPRQAGEVLAGPASGAAAAVPGRGSSPSAPSDVVA